MSAEARSVSAAARAKLLIPWAIVLLTLALSPACRCASGMVPDGGYGADGGINDFGTAVPDRADAADLGVTPTEGAGGELSCVDGLDNDGDELIDCEQASCAGAICCVGSAQPECCIAAASGAPPATVDLSCGPDLATCFGPQGGVAFGSPAPFFDAGGLAPGGDGVGESGVYFEPAVDLRSMRFAFTASFTAADACGDGCLEGVAISLSARSSLDGSGAVSVIAGLVYAPSIDRIRVVVHDSVVASEPFDAAASWGLVLEPTGLVHAQKDGASFGAPVPFDPASARLVVHGPSRNPATLMTQGARLASLSSETSRCDIPSAWDAAQPVGFRLFGGGIVGFPNLRSPSIADDASATTTVAFENAGQIFLARALGGDPHTLTLSTAVDEGALQPTRGFELDGVDDPELVWDDLAQQWVLFYTGIKGDRRVINRATANQDGATFLSSEAALIEPERLGLIAFDDPTAILHPSGSWLLIVRATTPTGSHYLQPFYSSDGTFFQPVDRAGLDAALHPALTSTIDFPVDAVADPSLTLAGGVYRLAFSRREGTRWSIGELVSTDFLSWRHPLDGAPSLDSSAGGASAISVFEPDIAPSAEGMRLLYRASTGSSAQLLYGERVLP